ncbi:MAG TPA: prolyl aminopeptidase [Frankiaceae bacterium]|nr:prolyl aminopeptidase [Frankiaceae bacterium]
MEPYDSGLLQAADGLTVYWETIGNSCGTPAVYLHGGPGSGSTRTARCLFDPAVFRAVLFDQRGCGRSRPLVSETGADLTTNTTALLVADLERLREHLGIDRWVVVGVSWGVTLGLVYAQRFPERVTAMVLAGVTSGTRRETDWITRSMGRIFPAEWDRFVSLLPPEDRGGDPAAGYARLLADTDPAVRERAAQQWCTWEDTHVSLMPGWSPNPRYDDPEFRMVFARLVTHYWSHGCFLTDDQIRSQMDQLTGIPAVLVHGRYDVSAPLDTAWHLHRAWPDSQLVILDEAGHGGIGFDNAISDAVDSFRSTGQ